eukprot:117977-Prorocentrum_minimum.AAC.2
MLAGLSHPNVVRFYGVCKELESRTTGRQQPSMVTEYMPAGSLSSLLRNRRVALNAQCKLQMAEDVARGMLYLHSRHIVHSDLKSDNLLVSRAPSGQLVCKVRMPPSNGYLVCKMWSRPQ